MQDIILVANGDLRESANIQCWPEQANMESRLIAAIEKLGRKAVRGHGIDPKPATVSLQRKSRALRFSRRSIAMHR